MSEKNLPFISVIVPFYNIEECVEYCLDSLVSQDYEGEYEILCVDDGSTDGTANKLDVYGLAYSRIRVLHKSNGGLSDARNYGIEHAGGAYVTFVDGDDFVASWYLSSLVSALIDSGCKQAVGRSVNVTDLNSVKDGITFRDDDGLREGSKYEVRVEEDHIEQTLYGNPFISAWAHLAPIELYIASPFPVGLLYEDTYSFGQHVIGQGPFAVLKKPNYGYVVRPGSITKRRAAHFNQVLQFKNAISSLQATVPICNPGIESALIYRCALEYSRLLSMIPLLVDGDREEIGRVKNEARNYVSKNLSNLLLNHQVSCGDKIRFWLAVYAMGLYKFALAIYKGVRNA